MTPHEVAHECAALRRRMAEAQALADEGKHAEAYGYLRAGAGILLAHVEPVVSDAEAEAVADSLVGQPVDSHVSRAYVGPGPERLAKRFPIMGGRR